MLYYLSPIINTGLRVIRSFTIFVTQKYSGKIEWFFKFAVNLFYAHKENYFYKKTKTKIRGKHFDAVFCSICYSFPALTALKTANYLNIPLFFDVRDMPEQAPNINYILQHKPPRIFGNWLANLYKKIHLKRRNSALIQASHITTISNWHYQALKKYNQNISLIYNGFDENIFIPDPQKTDKFLVSFFGRFLDENLRNPTIIFTALKKLVEKNKIFSQYVEFQWFVDKYTEKIVKKHASKFQLLDFMDFKGFVLPAQVPLEMNKSSILLLIENDSNQQVFGVLETKSFEYIGVNRPILCTPNNNGELAKLLQSIKCGLVSSDTAEIEEFILRRFHEWQKNGYTQGTISDKNRIEFSRKKGAEQIENILRQKTDTKK